MQNENDLPEFKVVTVANQKGGVGKTASVVQIASGLAKRGERVLMIDGDPQGNLTLFFGDKEKKDFSALIRALTEPSPHIAVTDFINRNVRRYLDIIPACNRNFRIEIPETDVMKAMQPFDAFITKLRPHYSWIFIDSSPANSYLERLLIRASDAVIIPLEFQLFSVSGLEAILDEVAQCSREANKQIRIHSLIFTKAENRLNRVQTYREVFSSFHIPIYEICKSEYVTRSLEKSRTIWECGPASYAARDYKRIIEKGFPERA